MSSKRIGWRYAVLITASLAIHFLSGCALMQVASVESTKHPASFQPSGGLSVVLTSNHDERQKGLTDTEEALRKIGNSHCGPIPPPYPGWRAPQFAAPAAALLELGVSLVVSEFGSAIQTYIDQEKAKFTPAPQILSANRDFLVEQSGKLGFNCVIVGQLRAAATVNKAANIDAKAKPDATNWDLVFVARLERSPDDIRPFAYKLVPKYFYLARSNALTTVAPGADGRVDFSRGDGQITTTVGITIASPNKGSNVDAKLVIPKMSLPKCTSDVVDTCITPTVLDADGNNPDDKHRLKAIETPWFTLPDPQEKNGDGASACSASKCFPSTITVSLTQVGNGSPDFDRAHTELDNGTKGLTDALNKIIEANTAK